MTFSLNQCYIGVIIFSDTDAHTQLSIVDLFADDTHTHTHGHALLRCITHVSPSRLQERFPCTHAALHATSVISPRVFGRIADCTVRYPGVKRPVSSLQF